MKKKILKLFAIFLGLLGLLLGQTACPSDYGSPPVDSGDAGDYYSRLFDEPDDGENIENKYF